MSDLPSIVAAMDRLNSFARTTTCLSAHCLKERIYSLKNNVLQAVDDAGACLRRNIYVIVNCRSCGGTGWFSELRRKQCHRCGASGRHRLYFSENRIGRTLRQPDWPLDDLIWHSPTSERDAGPEPVPVMDWKPLTPGKELTADELAAALNAVESDVTGWHAQQYLLPLGTCDDAACAFCKSGFDLEMIGVVRGRLSWAANVCKSCQKHYRSLRETYGNADLMRDRMPLPDALVAENVAQWMERHGGRAKVLHEVMEPVPF